MSAAKTAKTAFVYTDDFLSYKLSDTHPLRQVRLQMVFRLLQAYGVLAPHGPIEWVKPTPATEAEILEVHTPELVEAVQRAGRGETGRWMAQFGLGPGDTPAFPGMYEASALYTGGTIDAARMVASGEYNYVFNSAGGLHHAMPDRASGFCTFNDLATGVRALQKAGLQRVCYIDIDVHHGDGVQACFYDDPDVLTISLHETGKTLYPGTGFPSELGEGAAVGTSINLPYAPYTQDAVWHEGFDAVVPPVLSRFQPQAYVLQLGADAHWEDPLAHLMLSSHGWMQAVDKLLALTDNKPTVVTGGGGYNIQTVARLWAMVAARCAGLTLPDEIPSDLAAEFGITHLHDTRHPQVEESVVAETRTYLQRQIEELQEWDALRPAA